PQPPALFYTQAAPIQCAREVPLPMQQTFISPFLTSQYLLVVFDKNEAPIKKSRAERGDLLLTQRHLTLQDLP
ncbi:MAG: hypothetical protein P8O92_08915, partial [Luminiphilus sp.]|nr:hypothetical protein [Luminiphilus sp.]